MNQSFFKEEGEMAVLKDIKYLYNIRECVLDDYCLLDDIQLRG